MISDLDAAVITAVSHGYSDSLLKTGLQPEHITDPDARLVYAAGLELLHRTPPQAPNRLNLLASTWGNLKDPTEVKRLISMNGTGDVPPEVVSRKCQERHLANTVNQWKSRLDQLAREKPTEIRQWLPKLTQELEVIAGTGHAYNPLPSAHKGAIIRPVTFRSKVQALNKMFEGRALDGGGYRAGWWMVWLGITGRGKTTFLYTQAVDAVSQNRKVCVVSKENQSQVRARVLLGLTGLTLKEIETDAAIEQVLTGEPRIVTDREGNPIGGWHERKVRQVILDRYSDLLERHLRIYDWSFFRSTSIKSILSIEDPDQFHFDYIDPNDVQGNDKVLGLGKLSGTLEEIAHNSKCHMSGYFQLSGDQRKSYEKNDKHEIPGPFGSTMVGHTSDGMVQTKWGRSADTQHVLKTKCRAGGPVEEFHFRYNRQLWIYQDV